MKKNISTTCNNIVDSSNDNSCNINNLKQCKKMKSQKPNLSKSQKSEVIMSSNNLSDCNSKFSDSEVHYTKSKQ